MFGVDIVLTGCFIPNALALVMKKIVYQALAPLIGLPLRNIGRSTSQLSLQFGNPRTVSDRDGSIKAVPEWTIQVQCPWRISQSGRIVIAYRDFYYRDVPLKNLDVMSKDRSNSVFTTLSTEFDLDPPQVVSVDAEDKGNFSIHLANEYQFEAFPAESTEPGKLWRIFEPGIQGRSFVFPSSESK